MATAAASSVVFGGGTLGGASARRLHGAYHSDDPSTRQLLLKQMAGRGGVGGARAGAGTGTGSRRALSSRVGQVVQGQGKGGVQVDIGLTPPRVESARGFKLLDS